MTRVGVEPRLCDQSHRKNDAFKLSATVPTKLERDCSSLRQRFPIITTGQFGHFLLNNDQPKKATTYRY